MMPEENNPPGFDEELLRHGLDEDAGDLNADTRKAEQVQGSPGDPAKSSRFVPLAMVVVILSLVGFTVSNWMIRQQVEELTEQIEMIEARLDQATNMAADRDALKRNSKDVSEPASQPQETETRKLTAQVAEIVQTVGALQRSLDEMQRLRPAPAEPRLQGKNQSTPQDKDANQETKKNKSGEKAVTPNSVGENEGIEKRKKTWTVYLKALEDEESADRELAKLKEAGILAEKRKIKARGKVLYQLTAGRFDWTADGRAFIRDVAIKAGYKDAWLGSIK